MSLYPLVRLALVISFVSIGILPASAAEEGIEATPFSERGRPLPENGKLFELLPPEETGIDMVIPIDGSHPMRRAYHSSSACGAVAVADLNLDGKPDVFASSGPGANGLYLQRDTLKFENVAKEVGADSGDAWTVGISLVDFDNDGDFDIYLCNYDSPNHLFENLLIDGGKNTGEMRFEERAAKYGLDISDGSVVSAFADYDRDGDLDMYLLTHQIYREGGRPTEPIRIYEDRGLYYVDQKWQRWYHVEQNKRGDNGEFLYTETGRPDYLLRNDGEEGFTEVTSFAGITTERHWGNSATWWDYNNDGWPDIYVGNDFKSPDFLYRNNGDGTFAEVSKEHFRHTTWFSMGAVQTDFNNDGLFDFVIADMMPRTHYMQKASMASMADRAEELENVDGVNQIMRNTFHVNTGTDAFMESAWMSNLSHTEWTWAIRSGDFDNDGLPDLFFCNGVPRQFNHADLPPLNHQNLVGKTHWEHYENTPERREQNMAFRNRGDFQFDDVSVDWGLDHFGMSYGASLGDLDGDGRLDLLTSNLEDPLSVYLNASPTGNSVEVELCGTQGNKFGIGALVVAETPDGKVMSRQLFPYGGFLDADEPTIHFGLGENETVASLRVEWPSGQTQSFKNLAANHKYTITEPSEAVEKAPPVESRAPVNPWFVRSDTLEGFRHVDEEFDDFDRQPLMTLKLSQLGPGQAWGDIDNDGDPDFFLGGGAGQPSQLFRNDTAEGSMDITLTPQPVPAFSLDSEMEDMGAAFVDVDSDGDFDLYVASGSIECEPGDEVLKDRLYLNDGDGNFEPAPDGSLPDLRESTGVIAPADYDRDGDVDLFVGTRSIPGDYPAIPRSYLLRNDGGKYTVVPEAEAKGLERGGLVCSAIWSDVDNDGWLDLLTANDWGPIRLFRNSEGKLADDSKTAGLIETGQGTLGWWTGIDGRDIDNDGDIDFVATNMGRNTRYQASLKSPELLFYGDFDDTGKRHIVEARFLTEKGQQICYPWATFPEAAMAIPYIGDEMVSLGNPNNILEGPNHQYAVRPLSAIYDIKKLESSQQYRANRMDSSLLINDGTGKFTWKPLPLLSQISPGFGVVLRDVDLDGLTDCYIVQNHFHPTSEAGEFASGTSLLMKGTGDAENPFEAVWPRESGLIVTGDAKSLAAVDLNRDGREDFVVGVNNADPVIYVNRTAEVNQTRSLSVHLSGGPGNPKAVGARVTAKAAGMPVQTAEVVGGGSYLAQSESTLVFAVPSETEEAEIALEVRWPDGSTEKATAKAASRSVTVVKK